MTGGGGTGVAVGVGVLVGVAVGTGVDVGVAVGGTVTTVVKMQVLLVRLVSLNAVLVLLTVQVLTIVVPLVAPAGTVTWKVKTEDSPPLRKPVRLALTCVTGGPLVDRTKAGPLTCIQLPGT
jgi:hypothetical protein